MENKEQIGQILKKARETKGISLDIVHETTKIPLDILRALEEGYTVRTLTPFYYKGFVKIYAQYLDIDLRSLFGDYEPEKLPEHIGLGSVFDEEATYLVQKDRNKVLFKAVVILISLIVGFKVIGFIHKKIVTSRKKNSSETLVIEKKRVPKSQTPIEKKNQKASPNKKPDLKTASVEISEKIETQRSKRSKNLNLSVRAKDDSWLQVKADNNTVFQSTLKRGIVETWQASEKIEISGRNINRLEFEFNGKLIGTLGKESRKIRRVVFTKDGLSVQK